MEQIKVIYKDSMFLVIDKPAGLPVHKGAGRDIDTLDNYLQDLTFGLPKKPELAHRLDKDTSGCLVLGRHKVALKRLGELFQQQQIQKKYLALVHGKILSEEGEIHLAIMKKSKDKRSWWGKIDENGQTAITQYKVLIASESATLIQLMPITGRTHQLRIHMQALGHSIIGDEIYGLKSQKQSLCLHCHELSIPMYANREKIVVRAPIPNNFVSAAIAYGIDLQNTQIQPPSIANSKPYNDVNNADYKTI